MESCYPCMFCEAKFIDLGFVEDHIRECHSKDKIMCNSFSDLSD